MASSPSSGGAAGSSGSEHAPIDNAWGNYRAGTGGNFGSYAPSAPKGGGKGKGEDRDRWPRRPRAFDFRGNRTDQFEYMGRQLTPVCKDFLSEHPLVGQKSDEECDTLRAKHGIEAEFLSATNWERARVPKLSADLEEQCFDDGLRACMRGRGMTEVKPIQMQCWPVALKGYDLVGIAATGSGKTMAYVLPMIVHVHAQTELKPSEGPIALVVLPTRELCLQVRDEIAGFADTKSLVYQAFTSGADDNRRALGRVHIATATPGTLLGMFRKNETNFERTSFVVIDEADDLLDRDWREQVTEILGELRPDRQVLMFSATFQQHVQAFAESYAAETNPHGKGTIKVNVGGVTLSACRDILPYFASPGKPSKQDCLQNYQPGPPFWPEGMSKTDAVCQAIKGIRNTIDKDRKLLIFVNRTESLEPLLAAIQAQVDITAAIVGGNSVDANTRVETINKFKERTDEILCVVATDVLSRGHDFKNVYYVFNYDTPGWIAVYIHRIGRTGRNGQTGVALTFLEETDRRHCKEFKSLLEEAGRHDHVDPWLTEMAMKKGEYMRKWKTARTQSQQAEANDETSARLPRLLQESADPEWRGRGKSSRPRWLAELEGTSTASRKPVTATGPAPRR